MDKYTTEEKKYQNQDISNSPYSLKGLLIAIDSEETWHGRRLWSQIGMHPNPAQYKLGKST